MCGQAPGTRVHASGLPFTDPSGVRLRGWMGVSDDEFYDVARIAVIPMGFCFPGQDANGGDRPPRPECRARWHAQLFALLPQIELLLLIGASAQRWHLPQRGTQRLSDVMADWRVIAEPGPTRTFEHVTAIPLPHPSWRNNTWLKQNTWFDTDLLPHLRREVRARL